MRRFPFALFKVLVLAGISIGACIWGLRRAYRPRVPMVVPIAIEGGAGAPGEIAAPELVPVPEPPASGRGRE